MNKSNPELEGDVIFARPYFAQSFSTGGIGVHLRRMTAAVIWSLFLQFMMLFVFLLCVNCNIFHPLSWLTSFEVWIKLLVFASIIYIQGEVCKKDYLSGPLYFSTRFQKLKQVFSLHNVFLLLLHMVIGITVFWTYSSLSFYKSLTEQCKKNSFSHSPEYCLVENNLFLLLGGLWLGVYYFANDYIFVSRNLSFPLIQQYKFYRVKAALSKNIKHSMIDSVLPTVTFLFIYYLFGGFFRIRFLELMSCQMDRARIDSFEGIMNISYIRLIFSLWLFSCIFFVALKMMELLFNVHLTEHCVFPVTIGNSMCLADSLKISNVPIIHHLGYLDLYTLSTKSFHRRKEIFSISQPGGNPKYWNGIYQECTSVLRNFTSDLNKALQVSSGENLPKSQPILEPVSFHFHSHNRPNVRNLTSPKDINVLSRENQSAVEVLFNNLLQWLKLKKEQIDKKPYVAYFFAESPETRINYLLCQSQPVIWAVQSLSHLAAASLSEDTYGIVQRDLPEIIITIVNLKQVIDKLYKQNFLVKKSFLNDPLESQMKYLLRSSVKRSLYKIAVTFGPYIKDLKLPSEVEVQMNNFISFKEVL